MSLVPIVTDGTPEMRTVVVAPIVVAPVGPQGLGVAGVVTT